MNWRQIKVLSDMGLEIANHTKTHKAITKLSKEGFMAELNYIENKCDSLDTPVPSTFAYPGYSLNKEVVDELQEKGYGFARAGGGRVYDPLKDFPLLVPAWAANAENEQEIMDAFKVVSF
jgi:peptidoglycan-N-acetylglucosamine deacetylase